jgi:outer membrane protein OmpA-like peptidoglycan-associated protein
MITKTKTSKLALLKAFILLPVIGILIIACEQTIGQTVTKLPNVIDTLDNSWGTPFNLKVCEFSKNGDEILPNSYENIEKLALQMNKNLKLSLLITGHLESTENKEDGIRLSLARAEAVRKYLIDKHKIDPNKIFIRGMGNLEPISFLHNEKNERIEVRFRKMN